MSEIVLVETTVSPVGDARVGCGNLWEREYALPDGRTVRGMTAKLALLDVDDAVVVGAGSIVDLGGALWRVVGIEKSPGARGRVRLVSADQGLQIGGVELGSGADVAGFVLRALSASIGASAEDRYPVDWIERLYRQALAVDRAAADRLSRAVADALGAADARVDRQVLFFFERFPRAVGGDTLAEGVVTRLSRFPDAPPPLEPDHLTYRQRAIRVALRWGDEDHDRDPALLALAHAEALAGRGHGFLDWLMLDDPAWAVASEDALVAANPDALGDLYDGLRARGLAPERAVDRLLTPDATPLGRKTLRLAVYYDRAIPDDALRNRLIARIAG